jgi:hypothetical protein
LSRLTRFLKAVKGNWSKDDTGETMVYWTPHFPLLHRWLWLEISVHNIERPKP